MDYPLLNLFWTMLFFFLFIAWIWLVITVFIDVFRSDDLSGWGKALWAIFIIVLPWLGVLVYLIVRGGSMNERAAKEAAAREQAFRGYVREAAGSDTGGHGAGASSADEIAKLASLRDSGTITPDEFERGKAKLLA